MTNLELINEITACNVALCNLDRYLRHHKPNVYLELCERTAFLDDWTRKPIRLGSSYIPLGARIFCIRYNIISVPTCKICGKHTTWRSAKNKFADWCSISCACKDTETVAKSRAMRNRKYANGAFDVDKAKQTRYAANNGKWHADNFVEKVKTSKLHRHGSATYVNSDKSSLTARTHRYEQLVSSIEVKPIFSLDEFLAVDRHYVLLQYFNWECLICGTHFSAPLDKNWFSKRGHTSLVRCPTCHPVLCGTSKQEAVIYDFIKSIVNVDVVNNDRQTIKPFELDVFVPSKCLAFEFDGLYWHSENRKANKLYHIAKTTLCEATDIHLIHIFENEWLYKQDIVKSRIKNLLGIYTETFGARKCSISLVDSKTAFTFQNDNHLQGGVRSKVNLGLYYNDELVSLMTFSKPRFSKKYEWELVRFCNKLGHNIPGAAGRLLKHFELEYKPTSLVSYADRRWSYIKKNVYASLGFTLSHTSAPNYWYFKNMEFSSRIKYQKHKQPALLPMFDINKTEVENMTINGYNRIYDCGNLVYIKDYTRKNS